MAFIPGLHTSYNGVHKATQTREGQQTAKIRLSSDCRLQPAYMKLESLAIAGQHTAVNVFLSLVHTARQATKVGGAQQRCRNRKEQSA